MTDDNSYNVAFSIPKQFLPFDEAIWQYIYFFSIAVMLLINYTLNKSSWTLAFRSFDLFTPKVTSSTRNFACH